jgi:hypothetical protein
MLLHAVHVSSGPHGFVLFIAPRHIGIAAGVGIVRDHLTAWRETS